MASSNKNHICLSSTLGHEVLEYKPGPGSVPLCNLAATVVLLTITLKAPGPDVGPEARQDMGSLRHHDQKMR